MAEPRPLASLTSGLLARKGQAQPAMRRPMPGTGRSPAAPLMQDDLGWDDMGFDVEPPSVEGVQVPVSIGLTPLPAVEEIAPPPVEMAQVDTALPSMARPTSTLSAPIRQASVAPTIAAPARIARRVPLVEKHAFAANPSPMARFQKAAFIRPVNDGASNWVVQLGAYDSAAVAQEKWIAMAGRSSALAAFPVLTSQATVNGRNYHRIAISGFTDRDAAAGACRAIKARGGQCFVRETTPNAVPLRWAFNMKSRQFAGR